MSATRFDVDRQRRWIAGRTLGLFACWSVLVGNVAVIVWLWYHGGNVTHVKTTGDLFTSIARITGLLGAYLALVQVETAWRGSSKPTISRSLPPAATKR